MATAPAGNNRGEVVLAKMVRTSSSVPTFCISSLHLALFINGVNVFPSTMSVNCAPISLPRFSVALFSLLQLPCFFASSGSNPNCSFFCHEPLLTVLLWRAKQAEENRPSRMSVALSAVPANYLWRWALSLEHADIIATGHGIFSRIYMRWHSSVRQQAHTAALHRLPGRPTVLGCVALTYTHCVERPSSS